MTMNDEQFPVDTPATFPLFDDVQIGSLPPPRWLIEGVLPADALTVIHGKEGTSKSFLGLDWSLSVASGRPWFGRAVKRGPVLYVAAEGSRGLAKRVNVWKQERSISFDDFVGVHFIAQQVVLVRKSLGQANHRDAHRIIATWKAALKEAALKEFPALVVVDTVARSMVNANEDSAQDMGSFVDAVDRIRRELGGATMLAIHHDTKTKNIIRGSGALPAAADTVIQVAKDGRGTVSLVCRKQKDSDPFKAILLTLTPVTLPDGQMSCVLRDGAAGPQATTTSATNDNKGLTRTDVGLLRILVGLGSGPIKSGTWRKKAVPELDISDSTFYDRVNGLVNSGFVDKSESKPTYQITAKGLAVVRPAGTVEADGQSSGAEAADTPTPTTPKTPDSLQSGVTRVSSQSDSNSNSNAPPPMGVQEWSGVEGRRRGRKKPAIATGHADISHLKGQLQEPEAIVGAYEEATDQVPL
jgi:hypothetical protein